MKKILITGVSGFVGYSLYELLSKNNFEVFGFYNKTKIDLKNTFSVDIKKRSDVIKILDEIKPDIIVHTAALTSTTYCEKNPEEAWLTNTLATKYFTEYSKGKNSYLIFISTDLVFDGLKGNYKEEDKTNPVNVYGQTKKEAEELISQISPRFSILRSSLIYGRSWCKTKGADEKIINYLLEGKKIKLFVDEFRNFLFIEDMLKVLKYFCENEVEGLFHIGGPDKMSRYEFGEKIAEAFKLDKSLIEPASIKGYNSTPKRVPDGSLNSDKLKKTIPFDFTKFEDALKTYERV